MIQLLPQNLIWAVCVFPVSSRVSGQRDIEKTSSRLWQSAYAKFNLFICRDP